MTEYCILHITILRPETLSERIVADFFEVL